MFSMYVNGNLPKMVFTTLECKVDHQGYSRSIKTRQVIEPKSYQEGVGLVGPDLGLKVI